MMRLVRSEKWEKQDRAVGEKNCIFVRICEYETTNERRHDIKARGSVYEEEGKGRNFEI